ncbi:MAG: hypothetical protein D6814_00025 [Calditrichaeota bacterium]|nr:MAG: hypothetical protein D6814_00025 [Calditrichota bacterium]
MIQIWQKTAFPGQFYRRINIWIERHAWDHFGRLAIHKSTDFILQMKLKGAKSEKKNQIFFYNRHAGVHIF